MTKDIATAVTPRLIGYARVSTDRQDNALQMDALIRFGIARADIFTDTLSGARSDRPGLIAAIDAMAPGDMLAVYRVDRASRSARHLLETMERIEAKGGLFKSLSEPFDLGTPEGRFMFTLLGGFAEMERNIIRRRTKDGLAAAKARGVRLGAKPVLVGEKYDQVRDMLLRGVPGHRIASHVDCSPATIYKTFPGGRKALLMEIPDQP